jgi:hypothetical protein
MRFVNPGTVVAFRSNNFDLQYGRVVRSDTLSRKWLVYLEESGREAIVHEQNLAGVEDVTKRRSILSYLPAPDSANDIEKFGPNASLGHLILILRWCIQFQQELGSDSRHSTLSSMTTIVRCLAALASSVLGTEVSLHIESDQGSFPSKFADGILAAQILNLFSEGGMDSSLKRETTTGTIPCSTENTDGSVGLDQFLPTEVSKAVMSLLRHSFRIP